MNPLANPYVRIALGAVIGSYVAPKIVNRFVRPELDERDEKINMATSVGITAGVTAMFYIVTGMITGKSVAGSVAGSTT